MSSRLWLQLYLCLPCLVMAGNHDAAKPEHSYEGYVVDNACWDQPNHKAFDQVELGSNPQDHTVACMLMDTCKSSGYMLLHGSAANGYQKRHVLDQAGSDMIIRLATMWRDVSQDATPKMPKVTITGNETNQVDSTKGVTTLLTTSVCVEIMGDVAVACVGAGGRRWGRMTDVNAPLPEAVHDFWDDTNKQHTFHFPPAWPNEDDTRSSTQFYAYKNPEVLCPDAIHDFWDGVNKQHTFHRPPAWKHGDTDEVQNGIQFYASEKPGPFLEPIFSFWDDSNKQHTFHLAPEWKHGETLEQKGDLVFHAMRHLPFALGVYAFWDDTNKQHTFHFPPAWSNEKQGDFVFYAWKDQSADVGTEAVYAWWDNVNKQHTFHFAPAWKHGDTDEVQGDLMFYAYKTQVYGTEAIYAFWDDVNKQHTFHIEPQWKHGETDETKAEDALPAFYANVNFHTPPVAPEPVASAATATFDFVQDGPLPADFLAKCTAALSAPVSQGVTCTDFSENEGNVKITVSGSEQAVEGLKAAGTPAWWNELEGIGEQSGNNLNPGKGAAAPEVSTQDTNSTISACAPLGYTKAVIFLASGLSAWACHAM